MDRVKKFWQKLRKFIGCVDQTTKQYAVYATTVTTAIKLILASNKAGEITDVIPGHWDEELRRKMIGWLDEVIHALVASAPHEKTGWGIIAWFIEYLRYNSADFQEGLLSRVAAKLTGLQDGNKRSMGEYVLDTESVLHYDKLQNA